MKFADAICLAATLALAAGCTTVEPRSVFAPPGVFTPPVSDTVITPVWAESGPAPADFLRVYPGKALRLAIESRVQLDCTVRDDRKLDCTPIWEEYPDMGFGAAGVEVSRLFVVRADYSPDVQPGKKVILPIEFRLAE